MTKRTDDGGRARVIATARRMFQRKGFHQTAMAELSERAEVSVGQIYRLFASKSEMIAAIVEEDNETRQARIAELQEAVASGALTARDGFRQMVLEGFKEGEEGLTFEILAEGFRNPQVGDDIGELCDRYRAMLRKMILTVDASLDGAPLAAAEEMLLAILFGLQNRALSRPRLTVDEIADFAAGMILSMINGFRRC
jgi:TetR/AcrR family transcriptional repressor of uid operon